MTYYDLKKNITLKLDEYESAYDGEPTNETNFMFTDDDDIINKMPYAINQALRFAFYGKSYKETWYIKQGESLNLLEETSYIHKTGVHTITVENACSFYLEVSDDADITISNDLGTTIKEIHYRNDENTPVWKAFRGIVNTEPSQLTIEFGGDYYYEVRNICVYDRAYSADEKIPDYDGYNSHEIPSGLYKVENVYYLEDKEKHPVKFRVKSDKLLLPDIAGEYEIESSFFPDEITKDTKDTYELDVPKDIEYIIIDKACAFLSQEGEYAEFVSDSEQGMQMLDADRGHSAPVIITRYKF